MSSFSFQKFLSEKYHQLDEVDTAGGRGTGRTTADYRSHPVHGTTPKQVKRAETGIPRGYGTAHPKYKAGGFHDMSRRNAQQRSNYIQFARTQKSLPKPSVWKELPGAIGQEIKKQYVDPIAAGDPLAIAGVASTFIPGVGPAVKIGKAGRGIISSLNRGTRTAKKAAPAAAKKAAPAAAPAAAKAAPAPPAPAPAAQTIKGAKAKTKTGRGFQRVVGGAVGMLAPHAVTGVPTYLRGQEVLRSVRMINRARQGARTHKGTSVASLAGRKLRTKWKPMLKTQAKRTAGGYALGTIAGRGAETLGNGSDKDGSINRRSSASSASSASPESIKRAAANSRKKKREAEMHKNNNKTTSFRLPKDEEEQ